MSPIIRRIREEDIAAFYETFAIVVRERKYLAFFDPPPFDQAAAYVRDIIAKGYPHLIAVADSHVAGWCDITPPGRDVTAHVGVLGIALHPDWRGQGLGERLMREALAAGDAFGYMRIELGVFAHNTRAQALYHKLGFVEEGILRRRIRFGDDFHDEILMARFKA